MMSLVRICTCLLALAIYTVSCDDGETHHDYCVIGAGPGGLQMAYFLQRAKRDYIVFEKGPVAATFYTKLPIHRTLISINKRNTGKTNKEFNLRHDWNSLISNDDSLRMGMYSKDIFPDADAFVQYMNDFVQKLKLNVKFNTTIGNLGKKDPADDLFHVNDQHETEYTCKRVIVATGISKPVTVNNDQLKNVTVDYSDLSLDLEKFEGKSVLILGRGNSGFETAQYIMGRTNYIHMLGRQRLRLAWSTHYVGDLRAVNNGILDTYQLKSLDGLIEGDISDLPIERSELDDRFYLDAEKLGDQFGDIDNDALREGYDMVISCLGFQFDDALFNSTVKVKRAGSHRLKKYPRITYQYEASEMPGVFFAGTNTHSLDHRRSAGGFIHGFRYSARALHNILENRYHDVTWPAVNFQSAIEVIPHLIKRVNEASDIYQMFGVFCDIVIFGDDDTKAIYLESYPCALVSRIPQVSGHPVPGKLLVISMEYGKNSSGPAKDVFREDRAVGSAKEAHTSNFLHPIVYYYSKLPSDGMVLSRPKKWIVPVPDRIHHIVEDFTTVFDAPVTHVLGLRRFFETILGKDLRQYYVEQCMVASLVSSTIPESCKIYDMHGRGISAVADLKENLASMEPWLVQRMAVK
ncbi:FAD-dependent oxidoreductase domain-containing protein 2-like [Styela clava]